MINEKAIKEKVLKIIDKNAMEDKYDEPQDAITEAISLTISTIKEATKDKDDWEFEQFRICQQTAKEIFDEIEKVLSKRAKTYATKGMIKLSEPFSRGARTALFIFQTELQSLKKKFEMVE